MKKYILLFFTLLLIVPFPKAHAVTIETDTFRLGINGYLNTRYTYMSKMAMGSPIADNNGVSTFENDTNLIFNAIKDRLRANINLEFINAVAIHGQTGMDDEKTEGKLNLIEAFGQFGFSDSFQIRAGQFLSPFGIYNEMRFITSLYAPVTLPMMYQPPNNFGGHALVPADANLMVFGSTQSTPTHLEYFLYIGNGERNAVGGDGNKDKGFGSRIRGSFSEKLKIGGSFYSTKDNPPPGDPDEGRHLLYGVDLEFNFKAFQFQGEFVLNDRQRVGDQLSYYGRLTYSVQHFSPFIGLDYLEDKSSSIFRGGQDRFSLGTGYRFSNHLILKAEYHLHLFRDPEGFMGASANVHMFRTAAIFIF